MILSEEHKLIQEAIQDLVATYVKPYAEEADRDSVFPEKQLKALAEHDMLLIKFPEKYGGGGGDMLSYAILMTELGKECPATATSLAPHTLAADCIYRFGTEEQKQNILPKMATGELMGGFALTEPGAGSDAAGLTTSAVDKGDHYIVNGSKVFITSGNYCDFLVTMVKTDPDAPGTRGISAMLINKDQFIVGKHEDKLGVRGSHTVEIIFNNAVVPKENVLGPLGRGFNVAMAGLDGGKVGIASIAVGILKGLLEESVAYAKERVQFGKPISSNQAIQWMIADMAKDLMASTQLIYHAAELCDNDENYSVEAATAKLFCGEAAMTHAVKAIQIQGGYGYCKPAKVERLFRDAKLMEIYEGTSEVQRIIISRNALK